jgi:hypothetical protein
MTFNSIITLKEDLTRRRRRYLTNSIPNFNQQNLSNLKLFSLRKIKELFKLMRNI